MAGTRSHRRVVLQEDLMAAGLPQVSGYLQYHALDQALSELCTSTLQASQRIGSLR